MPYCACHDVIMTKAAGARADTAGAAPPPQTGGARGIFLRAVLSALALAYVVALVASNTSG